jgi:4-amino-4-deoxy-L-arabinose transferase-like glycosyltransferase
MCALIACLNATAWSVITPPFQGRDEDDHFAYVAQIAETGTLPHGEAENFSYRESSALAGVDYWQVRFSTYTPAISSVAEQRTLMKEVGTGIPFKGTGEAGGASSEPPLYYALETIPYAMGAGNVLVQLQLMRLFGALLAGITALLTFLFLRETLPRVPWAATVGAVCVALQPQFAFTSGSVNPDALLYALSAAVFLCLARGFHRRFTRRLAIVLGLLIAAGLTTYFSFIGVAVGAFAALVVLAVREARSRRREALLSLAIAVGIGLAPAILYALRNVLVNRHTFGQASGIGGALTIKSLFNELSYIWELYLPRLPGMTHYFAGITTWRDIWFDRSVGLYGWMDTMFPVWVDSVALVLAAAVALLCGRELFVRRHVLRARLPELGSYAAITVGVLVMLGITSYSTDIVKNELAIGEPRYLLPMLPLFGAAIALAVRGAGRRWMPVAGAAMVVLFLGHDVFSQLQVIARYYG